MKSKVVKLIKHLFWWVTGIGVYIYTKDPLLKNLIVNSALIIMVISYVFPWAEWTHEKDLKKDKINNENDLYIWTDQLNGGDNYLRFLFKNIKSTYFNENISFIYQRILEETNRDIIKIRLLRAYFKAYKQRQISNLYYKTLGTGLLSFVIFGVQAILQGRIQEKSFIQLFHPYNSWGFIFSIIIIALYYYLLPHRGENRLNLVLNILDEIADHHNKES
ncbi:hypothetical protein [Bacillus sp. JJ1122]|uniref:hypothetical protein n=1 Tax=Bacillus sp. JJ1122 TaxID=3122951 RepID=UPI002FFE0AB9